MSIVDPLEKKIISPKWIILKSNKILNLFMSYHPLSERPIIETNETFPEFVIELCAILNSCYHNICESLPKGNGWKSIECDWWAKIHGIPLSTIMPRADIHMPIIFLNNIIDIGKKLILKNKSTLDVCMNPFRFSFTQIMRIRTT